MIPQRQWHFLINFESRLEALLFKKLSKFRVKCASKFPSTSLRFGHVEDRIEMAGFFKAKYGYIGILTLELESFRN